MSKFCLATLITKITWQQILLYKAQEHTPTVLDVSKVDTLSTKNGHLWILLKNLQTNLLHMREANNGKKSNQACLPEVVGPTNKQ